MADNSEDLIYVRERRLPYETFDADNHLYENRDALTKFLPKEYEGAIKYVEVNGRTKLAIRDHISEYIPNPTFDRVAVPGGWGNTASNKGDGGVGRAHAACKPRVMPGIDAFFDPEPRLALMKDMGIDRTLLWPTLASVLEERVADDPDLAVAVDPRPQPMDARALDVRVLRRHLLHADHQPGCRRRTRRWRSCSTSTSGEPRSSSSGSRRCRPGRAASRSRCRSSTRSGPRSSASTSSSGMHSGDPGYQRYVNEWEGIPNEMLPFKATGSPAFQAMMSEKLPVHDGMASIIGHGLATRFPKLKFMPVEYWATWIRPFVKRMQAAYERSPVLFDEDPFEVFKRNIYVHIFHEPDPQGLLDLGLPADRLMFGSDFPHPEGMADPLGYSEVVEGLPQDDAGADHGRHAREGAQGREVRRCGLNRSTTRATATPTRSPARVRAR